MTVSVAGSTRSTAPPRRSATHTASPVARTPFGPTPALVLAPTVSVPGSSRSRLTVVKLVAQTPASEAAIPWYSSVAPSRVTVPVTVFDPGSTWSTKPGLRSHREGPPAASPRGLAPPFTASGVTGMAGGRDGNALDPPAASCDGPGVGGAICGGA